MRFYSLLSRLPLGILYLFSYALYFTLYYVARYRRTVVKHNLTRAFPEKSAEEIGSIARQFYRNLSDVMMEIIKAHSMPADEYNKRLTIRGSEILEKLKEQQQPFIILTTHSCNWEWLLHALSIKHGVSIDPVYKPLHNVPADKFIYEVRNRFGNTPLSMKESTKDIIKQRKKFRGFGMLADQSPISKEKSYWANFLNQPAGFYLGSEKIAQLTKFPVVYAKMVRTQRGYYNVDLQLLAEPPYDKDKHQILDAYIKTAEAAILEQPESWLWSNRRWKRSAPENFTE